MLTNSLYPPYAAQDHHMHADTSFWKVRMEKPAAQPVAMPRITQRRCRSHVKLIKHNKMRRQVDSCRIAGEIVCSQPRFGAVVEQISFVCVVDGACKVRFARQKFHRDITVQIAAQNIHMQAVRRKSITKRHKLIFNGLPELHGLLHLFDCVDVHVTFIYVHVYTTNSNSHVLPDYATTR